MLVLFLKINWNIKTWEDNSNPFYLYNDVMDAVKENIEY